MNPTRSKFESEITCVVSEMLSEMVSGLVPADDQWLSSIVGLGP